MRHARVVLSLAFAAVAAASLAEVTRTLTATLPAPADGPYLVENLAGTMVVRAAEVAAPEVVATVHARDEKLAAGVALESARGRDGGTVLRVVYPWQGVRKLCYPYGRGTSRVEYGGRSVSVAADSGVELWVDLEVRVPHAAGDATFRNLVGSLQAEGIEGRLRLDTASGQIAVRHVAGQVRADAGSGDVDATGVRGSFTCDTGSGDCLVADFDGEELACDTGSGNVRLRSVRATRLSVDTGSGDVRATEVDVEEFRGDTGSGDLELATLGHRLRSVWADTGSGDVLLRLPVDAPFTLRAEVGSGRIACRFPDAQPVHRGRELIGYDRASGDVRMRVSTGSGDVAVEPVR